MERLEQAYRETGQELDTGGATITLFASLEISLTDPEAAGDVAAALAEHPTASSGSSPSRPSTTRCSASSTSSARSASSAVGLVGLTVLFMIINTIRIAVYSRANEIEIMRLVGASDSFIRWPFILEGILCGLIGARASRSSSSRRSGIRSSRPWSAVFQMPTAVSTQFLATISLLLLAVGLGVGRLGSWISVRSYLAAHALTPGSVAKPQSAPKPAPYGRR